MYLKLIARVKIFIFGVLRLFFRFEQWHLSPLESRPYARDIVDFVNSKEPGLTVIEVGCGLGEIIGSINASFSVGLDISERVISAAKILNFRKTTEFVSGTFQDIEGHQIDYLILVNLAHSISPSELQYSLKKVTEDNLVRHLIVDEVDLEDYQFNHNFDDLVPSEYKLSTKFSTRYAYERTIKVYSRSVN